MASRRKINNNKYVPGQIYRATDGCTRSEFEDPEVYSKAVVLEEPFVKDCSLLAACIAFVNLSGQTLCFSVSKDEKRSDALPANRQNQEELETFELAAGESTHSVIPPYGYFIDLKADIQTSGGARKQESLLGVELPDIANKAMVIVPGKTLGSHNLKWSNTNDNGFVSITNLTRDHFKVFISKSESIYPKPHDQVTREKRSRLPDAGATILETQMVPPQARWEYRNVPTKYIIRALQPDYECGSQLGKVTLPSTTNYVVDDSISADGGCVVIAFRSEDQDGSIELGCFESEEVKVVSGTIAVSNHQSGYSSR